MVTRPERRTSRVDVTRRARSGGRAPRRILVTGFEPFGGDDFNPSMQLARVLDGETIAGHRVTGRVLPVAFGDAIRALNDAIDEVEPALVLAMGLAAGRACLSFERVAINLVDAPIADNAGAQPVDGRVMPSTRDAWFTNLPVKAMAQAARAAGVPAELSLTAGTYVCNAVFFALMARVAHARRRGRVLRAGFVHVPLVPAQEASRGGFAPNLAFDDQLRGVRAALGAAFAAPRVECTSEGTVA